MSLSSRLTVVASFLLISSFLLLSSAKADEADCKNILFANEDNTLVLFFHNNDVKTHFTMVRDGIGKICEGIYSMGAGGLSFYCSPEEKGIMRSAWGYEEYDPDKTFIFLEEFVTEQCAR